MEIRTVFFDFYGVLSKDHLYTRVAEKHPQAHAWIERHLFHARQPMLWDWMRGKASTGDVNAYVAAQTGLAASELDALFLRGVREMRLDRRLLDAAAELKTHGYKVGLVTDNMDFFTSVTVPHHGLGRVYDTIVNSADHGLLKEDDGGRLFDIALERIGEPEIGHSLLVDDTAEKNDGYRAKGGQIHQYVSFETYLAIHRELLAHAPTPA
jgi:FMN phosphatase YigB (HAD superfamily)